MRARCRREGDGPPLALIHGWGFGGSVFDGLAARLACTRTVLRPDLPGCGRNRAGWPGGGIGALAAAALAAVDRPAHWVGWSLGGLVALEAARRAPERVTRVTLLAATPRMVAAPDWPGIDPLALAAFEASLRTDAATTHRRFLALQARGCPDGREVLRGLRAAAAADGLPARPALEQGLALLRTLDLRPLPGGLSCPVEVVLGAEDALVPRAVAEPMTAGGIRVTVLEGRGHVPFAPDPGRCAAALLERP